MFTFTLQARLRFFRVMALCFVVSMGMMIVITLMRDHIVYFLSPLEWQQQKHLPHIQKAKQLRLGGIVKMGSVHHKKDTLHFTMTDHKVDIPVCFQGNPPSLFREGQGVVALGTFNQDNLFIARQILAKHDERYMPKEVADTLKHKGLWREP